MPPSKTVDIPSGYLPAPSALNAGVMPTNFDPTSTMVEDLSALIEATSEIGMSESIHEAGQKTVDFVADLLQSKLAEKDESLKVFLGIETGSNLARLIAVSHDALPENNLSERIEAAMAETRVRQRMTQWPTTSQRHALLCHQRLVNEQNWESLLSVELIDGQGRRQGVLLLTASVFPAGTKALLEAMRVPLGGTLEVVSRAEENRLGQLLRYLQRAYQKHRFATVLKVVGALLLLSMVPMPYVVYSDCELQPETRRYVSAPFDSKLDSAVVMPGDLVEQGDLLARLDAQEVKMELAGVDAEYHRAEKDYDGHIAGHAYGEAKLAQLKAEGLSARQALLRHRFDKLELTSPISGMVVEGDLKHVDGMPLERGQTLFEIALLEELSIEILIPAADISLVEAGMETTIRFEAFPFESFQAKIERINPAAEIRHSENVFVATAKIENANRRLRPGMVGHATTKTAWQPLLWHYLRKPMARSLRWLGW